MSPSPKTEQEYIELIKDHLGKAGSPVEIVQQLGTIESPPTGLVAQLIYEAIPDLDWEADHTHDYLTAEPLKKALQEQAEWALARIKSLIQDYDAGSRYHKEYRLAAKYGWLKDADYRHLERYQGISAETDEDAVRQLNNWKQVVPKQITEDGKDWSLELVKAQQRLVNDQGNVVQDWVAIKTD